MSIYSIYTLYTKPSNAEVRTSSRRLLKLAAFLSELPRKRFDYDHWVGANWKGKADLSCGTTACALGWATVMPEFRRLGLILEPNLNGIGGHVSLTRGASEGSQEAAAITFKVSYSDAHFLFTPFADHPSFSWQAPPSKATAKEVAAHIRRFVKARAKRHHVQLPVAA